MKWIDVKQELPHMSIPADQFNDGKPYSDEVLVVYPQSIIGPTVCAAILIDGQWEDRWGDLLDDVYLWARMPDAPPISKE